MAVESALQALSFLQVPVQPSSLLLHLVIVNPRAVTSALSSSCMSHAAALLCSWLASLTNVCKTERGVFIANNASWFLDMWWQHSCATVVACRMLSMLSSGVL
jgi:hypothetical protein